MKKILICMTLLICTSLVSCSKENSNYNVRMKTSNYLNTSNSLEIDTYNGYILVGSEQTNNEDGSITLMLKFDKPIK